MKKWFIGVLAVVIGLCLAGNAISAESREECMDMCKAAVKLVADKGVDAAIAEINKKDGKFVSETTFVILFGFDGVVKAHALKPETIGKNRLADKDSKGKAYYNDYITVAKAAGSGWVEHMWTSPDKKDFPKKTYVMKVEGQDMAVAAGYVVK